MKSRGITALVLAAVLGSGLLSGCSSTEEAADTAGEETSAQEETTDAAAGETTSSQEENAEAGSSGETAEESDEEYDDELADIYEAGVYKVGVEGTYAPYTYHDEDGELVGFDVEVAKAVAGKLGVEAEFYEADWDALLAGVDSGRWDTVINAVSITEERAEKYDFAGPYFYITQQIVVRSDNEEILSEEDLPGKKVATNITNAYASWYESLGVEIVSIETAEEAANMVISGRADFCDFNSTIFNEYLSEHPDAELKAVFAISGGADEFGIPVRKGEERLLAAVQTALDELLADGTIGALSEEYFGEDFTQAPEE